MSYCHLFSCHRSTTLSFISHRTGLVEVNCLSFYISGSLISAPSLKKSPVEYSTLGWSFCFAAFCSWPGKSPLRGLCQAYWEKLTWYLLFPLADFRTHLFLFDSLIITYGGLMKSESSLFGDLWTSFMWMLGPGTSLKSCVLRSPSLVLLRCGGN